MAVIYPPPKIAYTKDFFRVSSNVIRTPQIKKMFYMEVKYGTVMAYAKFLS